jgi:hypothetical protein
MSSPRIPKGRSTANAGPTQFALRFVSGRYTGSEYLLPPESDIVAGRGSQLDLVLAEDKVSRQHAKFSTRGGVLTVADLGSTNGTFVNGTRVSEARLNQGDRVLIGTSLMRVIGAADSSPELASATLAQMRSRMEEVARAAPRTLTVIRGDLEEVPLPDMMQMFANLKKTGVLRIRSERKARLFLRQGRLYQALVEGLKLHPRKAALRVLFWERGRFEFEPGPAPRFDFELEEPNDALIQAAAREAEGLKGILPSLPASGTRLRLAQPLTAPLSSLSPGELDVLQAVHNRGEWRLAMDECPLSDFEVATHVKSLLSRGYLSPP